MGYIEQQLVLVCTITGHLSVPVFASSLGVLTGIKSSAIGLKICAITAAIKKYEPIFKNFC